MSTFSNIQRWIDKIGGEMMDSQPLEGLMKAIVERLPKSDSTLCVGCGDGMELKYFKNAIGVDINPINQKEGVDMGDMHALPYEDSQFEMVFAKDVFEHSVCPIVALEEMARVSKKYVAIVLPDDCWQESGWHLVIPTMRQMISLAEKVGLKLKFFREIWFPINGFHSVSNLYVFEK